MQLPLQMPADTHDSTCYVHRDTLVHATQRQAYTDRPTEIYQAVPQLSPKVCPKLCPKTYDRDLLRTYNLGHTWGTMLQLSLRSLWPIFVAIAGGKEQFWTNPRPTLGKGCCETHPAGTPENIGKKQFWTPSAYPGKGTLCYVNSHLSHYINTTRTTKLRCHWDPVALEPTSIIGLDANAILLNLGLYDILYTYTCS